MAPSRAPACDPFDDASTMDGRVSRVEVRDAPDVRYERRGALGVGAMGEVHLCRDAVMDRDVAMKTPRADRAGDPQVAARLAREARIQGGLEHPAIVPVHDLGTRDVFFTMKRVQGTSLRAVLNDLRRGDPATVERHGRRRLLAAFSTICVAVAFAHSRGVIHRDIKPSNVMLGDFGEVYLLDWGVAKVDGDAGGGAAGTIGYMAPEQARGDADVDARADVYGLGALLFELLTFEPLHARDPAKALRATLLGEVDARPSVRAPAAKVPPELEALCVRATAFDPRDRVASARELHDAIERYLDGDRDVERRRALAATHATRARALAMAALRRASAVDRQRAIDEANRALALDPSTDAVHVIAALVLLTEPGAEADEALRESTACTRRLLARTGVAMFVPWLAGLALLPSLGVRMPAWLAMSLVATAIAAGLAWHRARVDAFAVTLAALVACDLAAVLTSLAFGPFLVAPGLLATCALAFILATDAAGPSTARERILRPVTLGLAVGSFFAPLALEWLGLLPPSIAFESGAIVLLPRAVAFPPGATLLLLVAANALLVIVPSILAIRVRDHAAAVERAAVESLSRTRQLLPPSVRERA